MLACEPPQPGAFGPEDPRDRTGDIGIEQALAACIRAEDPDAFGLEVAQRPREIGDRDDRNRVGGAAGVGLVRATGPAGVMASGAGLPSDMAEFTSPTEPMATSKKVRKAVAREARAEGSWGTGADPM